MKRPKEAVRLSNADVAYLDGFLFAWDALPDGAWHAAQKNALADSEKFKDQDPFQVWLAWCRATEHKESALRVHNAILKQQNAELLVALIEITRLTGDQAGESFKKIDQARMIARAAIQKAKTEE